MDSLNNLDNLNSLARYSADPLVRRRALAASLMQQGSQTTPIQSWTEGLARMAQSYVGAQYMRNAQQQQQQANQQIGTLLSGTPSQQQQPDPQQSAGMIPQLPFSAFSSATNMPGGPSYGFGPFSNNQGIPEQ